jgi:DNA-binding GntR family transcriptional regulator
MTTAAGPAPVGRTSTPAVPAAPPIPRPRPALTLVETTRAVGPGDYTESDLTVLTNRIAATLVHHDPGWRLPRPSALARHYNVGTDLVAAAIDELVARRLIRRLPDGQACRTSPAHYVLPVGHQHSVRVRADAVADDLTLKSWNATWSPAREDIRRTLGLQPGDSACMLQLLWTVADEPAAVTITYVTKDLADPLIDAVKRADSISAVLPLPSRQTAAAGHHADHAVPLEPRMVHIEVRQAPPWAARHLCLAATEQAVVVTIRYDEPPLRTAGAITIAAFRPEAFRITLATPDPPLGAVAADDRAWSAWDHFSADWDS